eukprot:scaffold15324_cov110-Skeletonema_marinoi.AAC.3
MRHHYLRSFWKQIEGTDKSKMSEVGSKFSMLQKTCYELHSSTHCSNNQQYKGDGDSASLEREW